MATHELKIHPELFAEILLGNKTAEIRKDDRGFQLGDTLIIYPYDPECNERIGNDDCYRKVTHIVRGGQFGIEPGYVLLSMK
ncbi:DUF3850 domain-containing protein [Iodobacter sp. CM08]|uniref:DUF3850 domain-containing protein n=1 Tax=Iodobacter sp. CM08 TaxID=3085902 RepID=UPI00298277FE|nr:DUF3850 domain-containing protein [Iodobacter sp. CM08]MDW5418109.1 DUF3850 domain-containing protein [Iodobacter sp. CM08]